jgi:Flp pilus assembly pilin Flp
VLYLRIRWACGLFRRDTGATMVEYAFLVMFIALAVIAAAAFLGGALNQFFVRALNCLTTGAVPC